MIRDEQGFLSATHVVRTPELVEFEFELAGLCSRLLAWMLDGAIAAAAAAVALIALTLIAPFAAGVAGFLIFIALFLTHWAYFTFFEWRWAGRTPGKRALGLRVVQESGVRIGFTHAVMRNLLRPLDGLPVLYAVGGGVALLAPSRQRLGDFAAGTVVVRERRRRAPTGLAGGAETIAPAKLQERLRRATVPEREILLSAALRRNELETGARLGLFAELAQFLLERFGIEKPTHLSDEKLVLEAVSALLQLEGATARIPRRARTA